MKKLLILTFIISLSVLSYSQSISFDIGWGKIGSESPNGLYSSFIYQHPVNDRFGIVADPYLIYNFDYRYSVGEPVLFGITGGMYVNLINKNSNLLQVKGTVGGAYYNAEGNFRFTSKLTLNYDYLITENHAVGISGGMGIGKYSMGFLGVHYSYNFKNGLHRKEYRYNSKNYFSLRIKPESITPFDIYNPAVSFNVIGDWTFGDIFVFGLGIGAGYVFHDIGINDFYVPLFINSMIYLGKGERVRPYLVMQPGIIFDSKVEYNYDFGGGIAFKCNNNTLSLESRIRSGFNNDLEFTENSFVISVFYSFSFRKKSD